MTSFSPPRAPGPVTADQPDRVQAVSRRLRAMRGPADGRGAFLGDGIVPGEPLRAVDLADLLDELLRLRDAASRAG